MKLFHHPSLSFLKRLQKCIFWILGALLILLIIVFFYNNWYRVIISPPELDPAVTQRSQIQILTKEYEELVTKERSWQSRSKPNQLQNIFNSDIIIK